MSSWVSDCAVSIVWSRSKTTAFDIHHVYLTVRRKPHLSRWPLSHHSLNMIKHFRCWLQPAFSCYFPLTREVTQAFRSLPALSWLPQAIMCERALFAAAICLQVDLTSRNSLITSLSFASTFASLVSHYTAPPQPYTFLLQDSYLYRLGLTWIPKEIQKLYLASTCGRFLPPHFESRCPILHSLYLNVFRSCPFNINIVVCKCTNNRPFQGQLGFGSNFSWLTLALGSSDRSKQRFSCLSGWLILNRK